MNIPPDMKDDVTIYLGDNFTLSTNVLNIYDVVMFPSVYQIGGKEGKYIVAIARGNGAYTLYKLPKYRMLRILQKFYIKLINWFRKLKYGYT